MESLVAKSKETADMFGRCRSLKQVVVLSSVFLAASPAFADPSSGISTIKSGISTVMGLIMGIAFLSGVIIVMYGAKKKIDGEPGAYYSIIGGALLAMAPAVMFALYKMFLGSGVAISNPTF